MSRKEKQKTEPAVETPAVQEAVKVIEKIVEKEKANNKTNMVIIATAIIFSNKQNSAPGVSPAKQMDASLNEAKTIVERVYAMNLDAQA